MPKYYVSYPVYATAGMTVEADSKEEAIIIAEEELSPCLCHQCAHEVELGDLNYENVTVDLIK